MRKNFSYILIFILILALPLSSYGSKRIDDTLYTPGQSSTCTAGDVSFNIHYIPSGSFASDDDTISEDPTLPAVIRVDSAYWMAETEVTYQLWRSVYDWATDSARGANQYHFQNPGVIGGEMNINEVKDKTDRHPVTTISWRDAMVWCNALSEMAGFTAVYQYRGIVVRDSRDTNADACDSITFATAVYGYRLPTSNEWELAARYQNGTDWTPGNHVSGDVTGFCYPSFPGVSSIFGSYAWYAGNCGRSTHPVATTLRKNALGLYDMSGNVWEWCFDWYPGHNGSARIIRGGGWVSTPGLMAIGLVYYEHPDYTINYLGFRFVRAL